VGHTPRTGGLSLFAVKSRHANSFGNNSWLVVLECAKVARSEQMTLGQGTARTKNSASPRFQRRLLNWFDRHKRDLPWRQNRDPYRIWLSEIMLQQTRVAAVVEHYQRFLRRFPTIDKLARSRESSVLAAWSGLGYYRRARMLHAAAKKIVKEHGGKFPKKEEDLRALPGIGRYTAAAVASIAFDEPTAVVDGNVERVLRRMQGANLEGEDLWRAAGELLDRQRPGDFNQGLMELGATVCLPRQPQCLLCPVSSFCATRGELQPTEKQPRQKKQEIRYAFDSRDGSIFLVKRPKNATLMPGMWEFPEIAAANGTGATWLTLRHSITMTDYVVRVMQSPVPEGVDGQWVQERRLTALPLTGLARKILRVARII
jgi:A/G-specific adenine glycosylase